MGCHSLSFEVRDLHGLAVLLTLVWAIATPGPSRAAEIRFREASQRWGLTFRHHHGGSGFRYYPETDGAGLAIFDYDSDGDLDVFFVDSGAMPNYEGDPGGSILHRNDGPGVFVDVTEKSGLVVENYGMGVTSGDVDGDGDLDLYVTAHGPNQLFRNNGDGSFTDVTELSGVGDELWGMSAAFADVDRDGDLDLYLTNYINYSMEEPYLCFNELLGLGSYCHPDIFDPLPDRFFINRGDGSFEDATQAAGFGADHGKAMGVVFADLDNDGWLDLYVANDMTPNSLYRNRQDGTFEDVSLLSGTAFSDQGAAEAGMGVALGDVDRDGLLDLYVTNFSLETNALYRNLGDGLFTDQRHVSGLAGPSLVMLGFGTVLGDFDNDADLDLAVANGHVLDNVEQMEERDDLTYRQRNQIFSNQGEGRFRESLDSGVEIVRASRGLAAGDLDGDADLDLIFTNSNDQAEVYENVSGGAGRWLLVDAGDLAGRVNGVGARISLTVGGVSQIREVISTDSYLSQSQQTVHIGLADATQIDMLRVRWPRGAIQEFRSLSPNRRVRVPGQSASSAKTGLSGHR